MNQPEQTHRVSSRAEDKSVARKPYQKPEVRCERVFETMALSCGKMQTTQGGCHYNRKTS